MKLPLCFGLACLLICAPGASGETLYEAIPLGLLTSSGGAFSVGSAINDSGQITGDSRTPDGSLHAFLYTDGVMADLGTHPGGTRSAGLAINNSGQVAGYSGTSGPGANHAFIDANGVMTDLGTLPGGRTSFGNGINASGQITGQADAIGVNHAFLYENGVMTPSALWKAMERGSMPRVKSPAKSRLPAVSSTHLSIRTGSSPTSARLPGRAVLAMRSTQVVRSPGIPRSLTARTMLFFTATES